MIVLSFEPLGGGKVPCYRFSSRTEAHMVNPQVRNISPSNASIGYISFTSLSMGRTLKKTFFLSLII